MLTNCKQSYRIMEKIDNLDKKILSILSTNARIPFKDVASECNVSRAAIHQRVQKLMEDGIIMENATLDYTITDKDVIIQPNRSLSGYETYPMVVVKGKVI